MPMVCIQNYFWPNGLSQIGNIWSKTEKQKRLGCVVPAWSTRGNPKLCRGNPKLCRVQMMSGDNSLHGGVGFPCNGSTGWISAFPLSRVPPTNCSERWSMRMPVPHQKNKLSAAVPQEAVSSRRKEWGALRGLFGAPLM